MMADKKDQRILEAAKKLFAKYGLKKTSISDIAKKAGVGKGTVYSYYQGKEELFATVVRHEAATFLSMLRKAVRQADSAKEKLRTFLMSHFKQLEEVATLHQITREAMYELWPEAERALQDLRLEEQSILTDILEQGEENGELEVKDVKLVSAAMYAAIKALETPWMLDGRELALDRKAEALVDLVLRGLSKK
ncbi:MAG: TetR/AcrR family transcriptional regulator [Deltaproteobacteria bacterium]|nr:TetR/AcrR family transcriptional regulator [Deltaproteobacteria bacterium]